MGLDAATQATKTMHATRQTPHMQADQPRAQIKANTHMRAETYAYTPMILKILLVPPLVFLINPIKWVCSCQAWCRKHATPEKVLGILLVMLMKPPPSTIFFSSLSFYPVGTAFSLPHYTTWLSSHAPVLLASDKIIQSKTKIQEPLYRNMAWE